MNTLFIKVGKDGFLTETPLLDQTDGYTAIQVGDITKEYILRYATKYRYVDGVLSAPGNLPALDTDTLTTMINRQSEQLGKQADQLTDALKTVEELKTAKKGLEDAVQAAKDQVDLANQSILELSDMLLTPTTEEAK